MRNRADRWKAVGITAFGMLVAGVYGIYMVVILDHVYNRVMAMSLAMGPILLLILVLSYFGA